MAEAIAYFDKNIPEENLQNSKINKFFRVLPDYMIYLLLISIVLIFLIHGIPSKKYVYMYGGGSVAYTLLMIAEFNKIRKERITDVLFLPASILVIFLVTAFCSGYNSGRFPDQNYPTAIIEISNKKTTIRVIRMIEKGVLSLDEKHHQVVLYPWENVVSVHIQMQHDNKEENDYAKRI